MKPKITVISNDVHLDIVNGDNENAIKLINSFIGDNVLNKEGLSDDESFDQLDGYLINLCELAVRQKNQEIVNYINEIRGVM